MTHSMRGVERKPWTDAERAKLRELHRAGKLSQSQMGARLGRSKNSVHRQLANLGLVKGERNQSIPDGRRTVTEPRRVVPRTTLPPLPSLMTEDP